MLVVVNMLLHALCNAYIYTLLKYAVPASLHDQGSTLGAIAALWHPTAKGCSSPLLHAAADQFGSMLVVVNMLLHALYNAYIYIYIYTVGVCCAGQLT
jgi:hypothetical protein